MASKDNLTNKR